MKEEKNIALFVKIKLQLLITSLREKFFLNFQELVLIEDPNPRFYESGLGKIIQIRPDPQTWATKNAFLLC